MSNEKESALNVGNELEGQRIVVTGGTGGIGNATAQYLADRGADVIISARTPEKLEQVLVGLTGNVTGMSMDLEDEESIKAFFHQVGAFDHLVTPAASSTFSPIAELQFDQARTIVETKQWGQLLCVHHALPHISPSGSITLFSGTVTQKPLPGGSMFAAVGAASEAAGRVWALELAPLRINTVVPGVIETDVWASLLGSEAAAKEQLTAIGASLPVGRVGTANEIAKSVYFLIDNHFVNGASLVVDGGHRLI